MWEETMTDEQDVLSTVLPAVMQGLMNGGGSKPDMDVESLMLEVQTLKNAVDVLQQQIRGQAQLTGVVTPDGLVVSTHTPFTQHATIIPTESMDGMVVEWLSTRDDVVVAGIVKRVRERRQSK
jgi:hypothetical protein